MSILILGARSDSHVRSVVERLERRQLQFLLLDHEDPCDFSCRFESDGSHVLTIGEKPIDPHSVWCRLKIDVVFGRWNEASSRDFVARSEWRALLNGVATLYRDRSVQKRDVVWRMELKPVQFELAGRSGFTLPRSAFFTGRAQAQGFLRAQADTIGKTIKTKYRPRPEGEGAPLRLMSFDVTSDVVDAAEDAEFTSAPLFFQARLREGEEYRVLGFPGRTFAYRVLGELKNRDRPDERHEFGHRYVSEPAPSDLHDKVQAFLSASELGYAAFDLVHTAEGWVFLECNPEGQWSAANGSDLDEVLDAFIDVHLAPPGRRDRSARPAAV